MLAWRRDELQMDAPPSMKQYPEVERVTPQSLSAYAISSLALSANFEYVTPRLSA